MRRNDQESDHDDDARGNATSLLASWRPVGAVDLWLPMDNNGSHAVAEMQEILGTPTIAGAPIVDHVQWRS